jgi:glycosyltransferase involved in cell wall biosynthesis
MQGHGPIRARQRVGENTVILLVQTAIPEYQVAVIQALQRRLGPSLRIVSGPEYFNESTSTAVSLADDNRVRLLKNVYLLGRRLVWQRGVLRGALAADVAIVELNPRILTVWATVLARRCLRRPTLLWGHAWPRRGPKARSDIVRHLLRQFGTRLVVYTQREARELRARMPDAEIVAAPNALYAAADIGPAARTGASPTDFLFVGRLVAEKKPQLLLDAFQRAAPRLANDVRLRFVGHGPLRSQLLKSTSPHLRDRIDLVGPVTDREKLGLFYASAIASVSPGYVGLSLIQSLSFGVPMLIAHDEPHSPEIEAARPDLNARFFTANSEARLADALVSFAAQRDEWAGRRQLIADSCRALYSIERTVDGVSSALQGLTPQAHG